MNKEQEVLMNIGQYILALNLETKEYNEAFNNTYAHLSTMNITNIKTLGENKYEITLCRPGLFIGSKGVLIDGISKSLGITIELKENELAGLVYPLDYTDTRYNAGWEEE